MPKYLGKGVNFHLVACEHVLAQGTPKDVAKKSFERYCQNCGFWRDAFKRAEEAEKLGKTWRKLVCIHPNDKASFEKWKPHVTIWGR